MPKKSLNTPRSRVRSCLRQLWLRSRERAFALKRDGYSCRMCGVKQSKAKGREVSVEVHHKEGITNWEEVIDCIYKSILCNPEHLETLCGECHKKMEEGKK